MATKKKTLSKRSGGDACSAISCHNARYKYDCEGLSFFRFPSDEDRCRKWVQNTRRQDLRGKTAGELKKGGYCLCKNLSEEDRVLLEKFGTPDTDLDSNASSAGDYAFVIGAVFVVVILFVCFIACSYKRRQLRQRLVRSRRSSCLNVGSRDSSEQEERIRENVSLPPSYSEASVTAGPVGLDPQHQQGQILRPPSYTEAPPSYAESHHPPPYSQKPDHDVNANGSGDSTGSCEDLQDVRKRSTVT